MLKETFVELVKEYTNNSSLINELWSEIEQNYSDTKRHYHTLMHLDNLLKKLLEVKDNINSWETILFTLFYHDIVYNPLQSDNEEKSAEIAEARMKQIYVPTEIIKNCKSKILATKSHLNSTDSDTDYFIDADLSILGQEEDVYKDYSKNVRLEFLYYPSVIYNKGRIQVLNSFLKRDCIFKTEYFRSQFEEQAKINLNKEVGLLEKYKYEFLSTFSNQWIFTIEEDGDWYEFFQDGAEILKKTNGVEVMNYYPGFFDSGYFRFTFKNVSLNLEFEGMLGIDLRTEPNPTEYDVQIAKEIYEVLKQVRNKNYA
jgi:predicted metal-dependent HD superfamily phosphohydrolase